MVECNVPRNDILVLPANLVAETANGAVLAAGAQTQDTEGLGNDNTLLLVVGRGDTLEDLQALHGGSTAGGLVGNHAADSLVEDAGGSAEVEGTTASGVETGHLAEVGVVLHCKSTKESKLAVCFATECRYILQRSCVAKIGEISSSCSIAIFFDHRTE